MNDTRNPLLADDFRIPFDRIRAEHVAPGIRTALAEAQAGVDALAGDDAPPTWENTPARLDEITETLTRRTAPAGHLVAVAETPALRDAYNEVLPEMTAFWSRLPLHTALWRRIRAYAATSEARALTGARGRHLERTLDEFRRAGADLPPDRKKRLEEVKVELATLEQRFSENVLDATAEYALPVLGEGRLAGVPDAARRRARGRAQEKGLDGWLLTLDYPSVEPILKYCDDRELRREIHAAYATRCREGAHDNRTLIVRILALRDELASILGFDGFPDYRLADRMARTGARAGAFEQDLAQRTRPYWTRDVAELRRHASALGIDGLEPWDAAYVMEKLRRARFDLDDEMLRPYFPLDRVLDGLFQIVERTFGFTVRPRPIDEVWHPDVGYYEIFDEDGTLLGAFYTDWFPRKEKRQGAWMNNFITGGPRADGFAPHLGVICANFTPPDGDAPALLTHREVETTFHEFGHLLHHCASKVEIASRAGINVAWDWVELPSQLMENWTWEREALDLFARHHRTGEPLPDDMFRRLHAARRFMGGWAQMRQISFGTVDLALHEELAPKLRGSVQTALPPDREPGEGLPGNRPTELKEGGEGARAVGRQERSQGGRKVTEWNEAWLVRESEHVMRFARDRFLEFSPSPRFAELHGLTSFTHLFSGGYAAGYYSYLWSEVLDADVFTRFRSEGIFNRETGRAYVAAILSRGDSADPVELFREFMGRDPDSAALLERNLGSAPDAPETLDGNGGTT